MILLNLIGLAFFFLVIYILLKFTFILTSHLFQVFGWISSDLARTAAKAIDAGISAVGEPELQLDETVVVPRRQATSIIEETLDESLLFEPGGDEDAFGVPRREMSGGINAEREVSLAELLVYSLINLAAGATGFILDMMVFPRRMATAIRLGYPVRCSVWYLNVFLCVLPLVIFMRVPDVYGYEPVIHSAYWLLGGGVSFIILVYLLRAVIPVDIETVFKGMKGPGVAEKPTSTVVMFRHVFYAIIVIAITIWVLFKLVIAGLFIMGFFYSLMYFLAFQKRGDPAFTLRRFLISWAVFGVFAVAAIVLTLYGGEGAPLASFALPIVILISLFFVQVLWVMARKYELGDGFGEPSLRRILSWLNQFAAPVGKLALATPMFYFVLLFFSVNLFWFAFGAGAAVLFVLLRFLTKKFIPSWLPGGVFAGYMVLVWISIFYVQSYNRIPPTTAECASIKETPELHGVFTAEKFRKINYLKDSLPYDSVFEPSDDALFVSFKNLTGYGSILRINPETGQTTHHIITSNNKYPGEMFYPERLCVDRASKKLYSTTKSSGNFQLLAMDYSKGLSLKNRISFPDYETTNCQVDQKTGDVYVIFLGPPDSHIRVLDGKNYREQGSLHFGRFGYADYFVLDDANDRLVVPSLDPVRHFKPYEVTGLAKRNYSSVMKDMPARITILGGLKASITPPTLGIARDGRTNMLYFTCPFARFAIESDGKTFKVTRRLKTGSFPREMAVNEKNNMLLIANYGDGTVQAVDLHSFRTVGKYFVGKLVRSITVEPDTGRSFAVSACGVYEIKPNATKAEAQKTESEAPDLGSGKR